MVSSLCDTLPQKLLINFIRMNIFPLKNLITDNPPYNQRE